MTTLYLVTYTAIARNVSTAALGSALAAIPRDTDTETLLGLVSLADVTTIAPPYATRSMSYTSAPGAMIPDPQLGAFLSNYYTATFREALSTPLLVSNVSTVVTSLAPVLWLRADAGASGPAVDDWRDLSGHGHDATQVSAPAQPVRAVNLAEDVAVVRFAGAQLLSTAAIAADACTYLMTVVSPVLSAPGLLFERGPNASTTDGENVFQSQPNSLSIRRAGTTHTGNAAANWAIDGRWHLAALAYSHAAGGVLSLDEISIATATALPAAAVNAAIHVGARLGGSLGITGDVHEIMMFPGFLDDASFAAVAAYMRAQVGI